MQPQLRLAALAAVLTCLTTGAALAQPNSGGVRIQGPVTIETHTAHNYNAATGTKATAITTAGTITGGANIRGPLEMQVHAEGITTVANGHDRTAITSVGSVHEGADLSGRSEITVSTGRIINVPGSDAKDPSCVIIGSVGTIPGCD
jgi:hypothetical protein